MTRALFVTTQSNDVDNHVQAWDSLGEKSVRISHSPSGIPDDDSIISGAKQLKPEVIFYIGAVNGFGIPSVHTFQSLRKIAPLVNLCSDAADYPWWPVLEYYRKKECFDLQVSIDGARNKFIDHATVTPVDPAFFDRPSGQRDILCGFSGTVPRVGPRGVIVNALKLRNLLTKRVRTTDGTYADHVDFLKRCRSVVNYSSTGTGRHSHIKGRVVEAGWAGCALLEDGKSIAGQWLPKGSFHTYDSVEEAVTILGNPEALSESAALLSAHMRENFTPGKIFGGILERLNVAAPVEKSAA